MRNPRTLVSLPRFLGALAVAGALLLGMLGGAPASAAITVTNFDGFTSQENGDVATQAGSHPFTASIDINWDKVGNIPVENAKDLHVDLPPGLIANPEAIPQCTRLQFMDSGGPGCPADTQVGVTTLVGALLVPPNEPVYNMVPGPNEPARFGFVAGIPRVFIHGSVRTGTDYGLTTDILDTSQAAPLTASTFTFWGVPGDPGHDSQRSGQGCSGCSVPLPHPPFLTLPTACLGPLQTTLRINSWQDPTFTEASFLSHNALDEPVGNVACDRLPFEPSLSVQSDPSSAASPTALSATLRVPQHNGNQDSEALVTSQLKDAVVSLPQGVSVNTSAASGLEGCSEAQFGLHANEPPHCPDASKIGTAKIITPLLEDPLQGSLYLAQQNANPFGALLAGYLVAEGHGVIIKHAAKFDLDPSTGQVTASFENVPQLPFSDVELDFFGGPRGVLDNPNSCGSHTYTSTLTSWSGRTVSTTGSFNISQNCSTGGFNPSLSAGTANPVAGAYAPFAFNVARNEGEQNVAAIGALLPKGELARLAGVPLCPESDATAGNCPAASRIGQLSVAVGAGPRPLWVPQLGRAPTAMYLAGPYKGDPYSVVFRVPAQAGPFDLGMVAVRASVHIDPLTAQVSVSSDSLPQMLQGVPLEYRRIRVGVDRPGFMVNPTNCQEAAVASTIVSDRGAMATPASRFQVGDCGTLGFRPKLYPRLLGGTKRGGHPKLRAVLKARPGDANVGRVALTLPGSELLDQRHIRSVCRRAQFGAGSCPQASVYGSAKAFSPLLDRPLEGPVYLRSSNHMLPDLVADLHGQVDIELSGRIDSVRGRIRTTFATVPDTPISAFVLNLRRGKKGLLVNSTDICHGVHRARVRFTGHNGKRRGARPKVRAGCKRKRH